MLHRYGFKLVSTATEYESMLAAIAENRFDLIFCDIMLEQNTGIDFLKVCIPSPFGGLLEPGWLVSTPFTPNSASISFLP